MTTSSSESGSPAGLQVIECQYPDPAAVLVSAKREVEAKINVISNIFFISMFV
jgi:hypothetical protein